VKGETTTHPGAAVAPAHTTVSRGGAPTFLG
jgi:hypothetical protein